MDLDDLRLAVYESFVDSGRAPSGHGGTHAVVGWLRVGLLRCAPGACRGRGAGIDPVSRGCAHTRGLSAVTIRRRRQVAHFLVPAAQICDDVVHSRANQRLFCLDLTTLWNLAAHWYDGRLSRGYVRRGPSQAVDYLHSVGLIGPFWST